MTSVSGHLTGLVFHQDYMRSWTHPPPDRLFDAPVETLIPDVCKSLTFIVFLLTKPLGPESYCQEY